MWPDAREHGGSEKVLCTRRIRWRVCGRYRRRLAVSNLSSAIKSIGSNRSMRTQILQTVPWKTLYEVTNRKWRCLVVLLTWRYIEEMLHNFCHGWKIGEILHLPYRCCAYNEANLKNTELLCIIKLKLQHPPPGIPRAFDSFSCPWGEGIWSS